MNWTALMGYGLLSLLGIILSGLFSGLETGLYTLNRVRVAVRAARGDRAADLLMRELGNQNRMLSTVLIGTNAASYLASYGLAAALHETGMSDWSVIVCEMLIFTPVLFVFAETLPKDLFRTHTDHWSYTLAPVLLVARWLLIITALLPLVQGVGTLLARLMHAAPESNAPSRQRISHLIKEGLGTGVLSEAQTTLADRALALHGLTAGSEMIPWRNVVKLAVDADRSAREVLLRTCRYTRVPVVNGRGHVVGVISLMDIVMELDTPARDLMKPPTMLDQNASVLDAVPAMRAARQKMAIVAAPADDTPNAPSRPIGLVTLKDLVEPLTGELGAW